MSTPWRTVWRKSTHSGGADWPACVEVAPGFGGVVYVRDSTRPCGPVMELTPTQWRALLTTIKET